jgi:hypothetical protein
VGAAGFGNRSEGAGASGFADPRLATQKRDTASTRLGLVEPGGEGGDFQVASDEWSVLDRRRCHEAESPTQSR